MNQDSPRWEEINPSEHSHEKDGLRALASYLPDADPYHVWANVEFVGTDGSINEIDALVLTRSGLYIVELKHWAGTVSGDGTQWVRRMANGRLVPQDNPLVVTNRKARRLASLIKHYASQKNRQNDAPFVGAVVFLHHPSTVSQLDEVGQQHIYGLETGNSRLPSLKSFLLAPARSARGVVDEERGRRIVDYVRGARIRPSIANRRVGQVLLRSKPFAEGVGWQDFLGGHVMDKSLVRRVRFYLSSRAAAEDVPAIEQAAEREFRLLQGINHQGIAKAHDFEEHAFGRAVVFEHNEEWVRLDHWLAEHGPQQTIAQRLQMVQDLAEIIGYAHARRLAHRALNPRALYVANPGSAQPSLVVTDWQAAGRLSSSGRITRLTSSVSTDPASLELFFDDSVRSYQAPEAVSRDNVPGPQLDVFSLGALAYRIFSGKPPAETPEDLIAAVRDGGLSLAGAADGMPDALQMLIWEATRGNPGERTVRDVAEFRARLERVWDELTRPEAEPVVDPLDARKGVELEGGYTVVRRLGTGGTATALLVTEETADGPRERVLKVARDEQFADRLEAEAQVLRGMRHHWQVAELLRGPVQIGGRTTLVLESAGQRTVADELSGGRRLAIELLERYGRDLIDIVDFLEGEGVWHRDLKPANLAARPRPKDRKPHLCVFDFSLAAAPADQITVGTRPYLDPFLGPPRRMRYDAAAERFATAVTLYEMATGEAPRWGDGANPAAVSDEVTLDPSTFDAALADRLVPFFARALRRDATDRFDTTEEMADAWRAVFKELPRVAVDPQGEVTRRSPLESAGLTPRALSALERLGVHTVGELLDYEPSKLTKAAGVPDATRKEILRVVGQLHERVASEPEEQPQPAPAFGVEALCQSLLPGPMAKDHASLATLLGQAPTARGRYLRWLSQADAAAAMGVTQPQVSNLLRKHVKTWAASNPLRQVQDALVALLDVRAGVMSSTELAEALIASRGSYSDEPRRTSQAIGLVRAAVEAELSRGGASRVAIHRFRGSDLVLVGREPDDADAVTAAADLLGYAVQLGKVAVDLAKKDPFYSSTRALDALRQVTRPDGAAPIGDARLLQLAAAASNSGAGLSAQGQFYPVGMPAERAVRLSRNALLGQTMAAEQLRARVASRFPLAAPLPAGILDLEALLARCDVPVDWDAQLNAFVGRRARITLSSTKIASSGPVADDHDALAAETKLRAAVERNGFLSVLVPMQRLVAARTALLNGLGLTEVNVTGLLMRMLRELGFPWDAIVAADNGNPDDPDFRSLVELVAHEVMPALTDALAAETHLLLTDATPLARYGQLSVLQELADPSRSRPGARLLLVAARRPEPAMLDTAQLPLTSPASQSLWLPGTWPLRTAPEGIAS
ncbi:BREX system serine/threonine kinase PglW [Asanoa iriomotensis]|uniref:BREX system serine/threonine kinase PglW n=1 Tax=Asanoa iriomotensis TaxID=234613 RepID=UPI001945B52E|nr:BREX system serine/threonine kinase PglW [Asanoa iriomotensis]